MAIQAVGLRRSFPWGETRGNRKKVSWIGVLSPGEFGRTYTLEMIYSMGDSPKVWVREPNLREIAGERRLPHVYDQQDQLLCLHLPGCGFWKPEKPVANTIMMWAWLWLYYFELWLVTNKFYGKGEHPS